MKRSEVDHFFDHRGPLARLITAYEPRPSQLAVARAVAEAVDTRASLLAEAGTGTGKTMAYLVPALASGLRVVVSTGTKNLQDQLVHKDVPTVLRALGRDVHVEGMKGRGNYLCELRAEVTLAQGLLPNVPGARLLEQVRDWRGQTQTGDRAELAALPDDAPIWRELSATGDQCMGRVCPHYERCWITQMRRRAQNAQLIIVNHHLYLADAALRMNYGSDRGSLLPPHDIVIFDEAHELDDIAAQHFGFTVAERRVSDLCQDVASHGTGGLLLQKLQPTLQRVRTLCRDVFDEIPFAAHRFRLRDAHTGDAVQKRLGELDGALEMLESTLVSTDEEESRALGRRVATLAMELAFVLHGPMRSGLGSEVAPPCESTVPYVRYTEKTSRSRSLVARPIDVASTLGPVLGRVPAIFVSATLKVGRTFGHFKRRCGVGEAAEVCVASPFDYPRQATLYLPQDLPEPEAPAFASAAAERVQQLVHAAQGGAFVLCTSHRAMQTMRTALRGFIHGPLLVQGDAPKDQLIGEFRKHGNAVLIATLSFWKGIDVPGRALRLVIMDKLPFASPTDPVVEARMEHMREAGLDPFMGYQLPQAALLLRQGFGRLIRRESDLGMVAILDRRLTTRRYGPMMLGNLPACRRLYQMAEAVAELTLRQRPQTALRQAQTH